MEQAAGWEGGSIESAVGRPVRIPTASDVDGVDFELPQSNRRIAGVVVGADGAALANVVVSTRPGRAGFRVLTGDDGAFVLDGLLDDSYVVHAEHPGLPPADVPNVPAGTENLRVRMHAGATLSGRVARAAGSVGGAAAPVGPFTVWAQPARPKDPSLAARDGALAPVAHQWIDGHKVQFELGDLAPGSYDLVALTLEGDSGSLAGVTVKAGEVQRDLIIELGAGAEASGRLVDLDTRAPLAGVAVRASCEGRTRQGATDAAGSFHLDGIARGVPCDLEAQQAGYVAIARGFSGPVDRPVMDLGTIPVLPERFLHKHTGRVGMTFGRRDDGEIVVRNAPEGSAAGKAGLKSGDVILTVDDRNVHNADARAVVILVGGPPNQPLLLQIRGGDGKSRQVRVVRM